MLCSFIAKNNLSVITTTQIICWHTFKHVLCIQNNTMHALGWRGSLGNVHFSFWCWRSLQSSQYHWASNMKEVANLFISKCGYSSPLSLLFLKRRTCKPTCENQPHGNTLYSTHSNLHNKKQQWKLLQVCATSLSM